MLSLFFLQSIAEGNCDSFIVNQTKIFVLYIMLSLFFLQSIAKGNCDSFIVMITKAKQTKVLISLFFRFRRHHFGHECQRQSPSTLVRHDQESRPSPCQDPLLECQLHRLIDTTNCYYIYFFSLHATGCHNEAKVYMHRVLA